MGKKKGNQPDGFVVQDRRKGFGIIGNDFVDWYGPIVGAYGIAAYCILVRFATASGEDAKPSYNTVARLMKATRPTAIKSIRKLVSLKLVGKETRIIRGEPATNIYTILDIPELTKVDSLQEIQEKIAAATKIANDVPELTETHSLQLPLQVVGSKPGLPPSEPGLPPSEPGLPPSQSDLPPSKRGLPDQYTMINTPYSIHHDQDNPPPPPLQDPRSGNEAFGGGGGGWAAATSRFSKAAIETAKAACTDADCGVFVHPSPVAAPPPLGSRSEAHPRGSRFQARSPADGDAVAVHAAAVHAAAVERSVRWRQLAVDQIEVLLPAWSGADGDLAGWDDEQVHCLLTWLRVLLFEAMGQNGALNRREQEFYRRYYATHYGDLFAGVNNRVGLIKRKVAQRVEVALLEEDAGELAGELWGRE